MTYYERHLPHWQPENASLFVTWRLHGTLPSRPKLAAGGGRAFVAFDSALAADAEGPRWLQDDRVAKVVADSLHYGELSLALYDLQSWVVMPNHVHILIAQHKPLAQITRTVKGYSARQANALLERQEAFWQSESYDRWVRDSAEWNRIVRYIEENPVSAGLASKVELWKWSSAGPGEAGLEARPTGRQASGTYDRAGVVGENA